MKPIQKRPAKDDEKYNKISKLLNTSLGLNIDSQRIKDAMNNMSLSDVIALDTAIDEHDKNAIEDIFNTNIKLEYVMPGAANTAPTTNTTQKSIQPKTPTSSMTPTQLRTKKQLDQMVDTDKEKRDQADLIADKEKELADMKRLAGLK